MRVKVIRLLAVLLIGSPVSSLAQEWTGTYGGLGISSSSGTHSELFEGSLLYQRKIEGRPKSFFLGYSRQSRKLVLGAEVSYGIGKVELPDVNPELNYADKNLDVKARIGYSFGKALVFLVAGWTRLNTHYAGVEDSDEPIKANGVSYGIGADYMLNKNWFIGAEILHRNVDLGLGALPNFELWSQQWEYKDVSLRLAYRF